MTVDDMINDLILNDDYLRLGDKLFNYPFI